MSELPQDPCGTESFSDLNSADSGTTSSGVIPGRPVEVSTDRAIPAAIVTLKRTPRPEGSLRRLETSSEKACKNPSTEIYSQTRQQHQQ